MPTVVVGPGGFGVGENQNPGTSQGTGGVAPNPNGGAPSSWITYAGPAFGTPVGDWQRGAPNIDPRLFTQPAGDIHQQLGNVLGTGTELANWITNEEQRRYQESLGLLQQGAKAFDTPSMTDLDIRRQFGQSADAAARTMQGNLGNLRSALGSAGVGTDSGLAAGLATGYEARRQASLTDATRSLYEKRVEVGQQDRAAKWLAQQAVAAQMGKDPSVIGLDWLGSAATAGLGLYGIDAQLKAAHEAAKAQETAGCMSMIGSLGGAAIGAI